MDRHDYEEQVLEDLRRLRTDVTDIKVEIAAMPSKYVTRREAVASKKDAIVSRRWAVSSFIGFLALALAYWQAIL